MPCILLSGFEPFGHHKTNPSMTLVQGLHNQPFGPDAVFKSCVLPVVRQDCIQQLLQSITKSQPIGVIAFGVSSRPCISLERIAINIDDFPIPDNAGNHVCDQTIVKNAPLAYRSTLPLKTFRTILKEAGFTAEISQSAGSYVCNHLFFQLQHAMAKTGIPSGFIHIPSQNILPHDLKSAVCTFGQYLYSRTCHS